MGKTEFLLLVDELLDLDAGTLKGSEALEALAGWDSMAVIGFMALADEQLGVRLRPAKMAGCTTLDDLIGLCGSRVRQEAHV